MIQQDKTAPELAVKVSRKERYQQVFELLKQDETADDSMAGLQIKGDVLDGSGSLLCQATCTNEADNVLLVVLSTTQMSSLRIGKYTLEVYGLLAGERDDLVKIIMTVV